MLKNIDNKENDRSNLSAWQVLFMPQLPLQGWASNKLAWNISRCPSTAHPTLIFFLTLVLIRWFQTLYFFFPTAKNIQSYGDTSKFWVSLCSSTAVCKQINQMNPFTLEISLVILLTVYHTILMMLVWRICFWIN